MNIYDKGFFSSKLNRYMNVKVIGHYGLPILVFPCQDKMSDDWLNEGMVENLEDYIENGQIKLFCVDSVDYECISDTNGENGHRSYIQEMYFQHIIEEVLPLIYDDCKGYCLPLVTGCSNGANQAAFTFFRRPELFSGVLAFSGVYNLNYFFGDWCDERLYLSSPLRFIPNMPFNHPYIEIYNSKKMIFVIGKGSWEHIGLPTQYELERVCKEKGINAWFDYWGEDVAHDWNWWKIQIRYFLPKILYE